MNSDKIFFILCVLGIIAVLLLSPEYNGKSNTEASVIYLDVSFYKLKFEDHEYLALNRKGYFIHSESCPCKKGK